MVSDRAVAWINQHLDQQWFLWLHYFDPHTNYVPPEKFRKALSHPYDGEIAYVDHELGRVIAGLEKNKIRGRTLIIVTSDHGESLGEHEERTHGYFLYESTAHVPLIVSLPGAIPEGRVVSRLVSLMDLAPTILEILGVEPPDAIQGRSLLSLLYSDPEGRAEEPVLMETLLPWHEHAWSPSYAILNEGFKFIKAPRPELYDLEADPGETKNIYAQNRGRAEAMARVLEQTRRQYARDSIAAGSELTMNDETRDRLASLGYVFTGSGEKNPSEKVPDVKDMIEVQKMVIKSETLKKQGKTEEALSILEEVLKKSPDDKRILKRLGYWNAQIGNYEKAELYAKKSVQLDPNFTEGLLVMGLVYTDTGRFPEAEVVTDTILELSPDSAKAHNLVGYIQYKKKNYKAAIPHFNKALELFPTFHSALINLGLAQGYPGEYDKAYQTFEKAHRILPEDARSKKMMDLASKSRAGKSNPGRDSTP